MPVLPAPTASLPDESSCGTTQPGSPNSCQGNGMGSVGPPQGAPSLARVDPAQPFISTLQVRLSSGPSSSGLHSGGFPEGKQECETVDPRALPLPSPTLTDPHSHPLLFVEVLQVPNAPWVIHLKGPRGQLQGRHQREFPKQPLQEKLCLGWGAPRPQSDFTGSSLPLGLGPGSGPAPRGRGSDSRVAQHHLIVQSGVRNEGKAGQLGEEGCAEVGRASTVRVYPLPG